MPPPPVLLASSAPPSSAPPSILLPTPPFALPFHPHPQFIRARPRSPHAATVASPVMAQAPARTASAVRLFDAHCLLQDPRIAAVAPALIRAASASGVARFAVNGTSEKDWQLVKQMAEDHPAVVPCFGLHPWCVPERSPDWMNLLWRFFAETPEAAVGEGLQTATWPPVHLVLSRSLLLELQHGC